MRVERALVGLFLAIAMAATGCTGGKLAYNLPPAQQIMHPGPGVGGPGPGVIPPPGMVGPGVGRFGNAPGYGAAAGGGYCGVNPDAPMEPNGGMMNGGGVMQASFNSGYGADYGCGDSCGCGPAGDGGACCDASGCGGGMCGSDGCGVGHGYGHGLLGHGGLFGHHGGDRHGINAACYAAGYGLGAGTTSQVAFLGEEGVQVGWDVSGVGTFDSTPLVIPGRQNFYQGAIYRLRLTNIPGRAGVTLYPTLEIAPVTPRTDAYLAHSPIPVQFTEEDFDQVLSDNFVTKVIYLPDPEFQELALAGVETLVSTRLDPGVDPIAEADRRGSILAILRMGNKDLEPGASNVTTRAEFPTDTYVPGSVDPGMVEPMSYDAPLPQANLQNGERTADYEEDAAMAAGFDAEHVQYCQGGACGSGYADSASGTMPMGMPTGGFAPPAVPPHMIAGGPDWGMPITGTPIGLPGPPHIPLGVPAGLQKHVMHNRTRHHIPPPVAKVKLSVKQRPGLNYPRPVTHAHVDETQREPFRIWPFNWSRHSGHFQGGPDGVTYAGSPAGDPASYPCP